MKDLKLVHQLFIGKVIDEIGSERTTELLKEAKEAFAIPVVVSSLTAKDKLYLNTLLVNKLLEKEDDGTYKAVNDVRIMDKINDLMEKVNNS